MNVCVGHSPFIRHGGISVNHKCEPHIGAKGNIKESGNYPLGTIIVFWYCNNEYCKNSLADVAINIFLTY